MIPVHCIVKHDPENGQYADCFRACVASLLEMKAEEVPHFLHDNCPGPVAFRRLREFLRPMGLAPFMAHYDGEYNSMIVRSDMETMNPGVHYLLFGSTIDGDHVVVCKDRDIVHNPAWDGGYINGPGSHGCWSVMVLARV